MFDKKIISVNELHVYFARAKRVITTGDIKTAYAELRHLQVDIDNTVAYLSAEGSKDARYTLTDKEWLRFYQKQIAQDINHFRP